MVELIAKAERGGRASYEWQTSRDGIAWTNMPSTLQAKTSLAGLTPGDLVYFRVRAIIKGGAKDWSAAISIIVM